MSVLPFGLLVGILFEEDGVFSLAIVVVRVRYLSSSSHQQIDIERSTSDDATTSPCFNRIAACFKAMSCSVSPFPHSSAYPASDRSERSTSLTPAFLPK